MSEWTRPIVGAHVGAITGAAGAVPAAVVHVGVVASSVVVPPIAVGVVAGALLANPTYHAVKHTGKKIKKYLDR
jgi:uncharacterized protein involved in response to NO